MKTLPLIVVLFVQASALAQGPQLIRLKEATADFPRSQLQIKTNGPVSIDVSQGERAAYEKLAGMAGLNIVIDPDFRDSSAGSFRIDNVDVLQAFDLLSARSRSFVEVLNSNTIIVSPDNQTKRRDYEFMVLKTFYLPAGSSPQRLTEVVTTLRTTLQARYLLGSTTANAVVMRDSPARIAAAEKIIASSMPLAAGPATASIGETIRVGRIVTLDGGVVRESAPSRSMLNSSGRSPVSLDVNDSTRAIFEKLARGAGVNVIFDPDFRSVDGSLKADKVDIADALDILAFQTRTFWEPIDGKTILVAPDNQTKRRDFENVSVKTFYLPNASQVEVVELLTGLRTLLNARYLASVNGPSAIVMRDSAVRLALAERIISDLRRSPVVSAPGFPSGSEAGFVLNRRAAQALGAPASGLQPRVRGPFSFDANDSVRATYESIAATAGLRIVFDSRFQGAAAVPFKVSNIEIADALDFLSLQSRNIWQIMDGDTVFVAPDNQTVRADVLTRVTKTINLTAQGGPPRNIQEVVTALRTLFNLRQIATLDNSIVVTDTVENIAFAEKMLKDLDGPAR